MKIVPPSYSILGELDRQSLAVRIEYCGRICYKSEDKIDHESAIPFVRKMSEHGHNSVLEMGVVSLRVQSAEEELISDFFARLPRYLHIDHLSATSLLITASIRAFREFLLLQPDCKIAQAVGHFLTLRHPYFFDSLPLTPQPQAGLEVSKIALTQIEQLPPAQLARHRHLAVKFIVNRAVTHEIVRHRPCSFLQESQRYCRYADNKFGGEVAFIKPMFFVEDSPEYQLWLHAMAESERIYLQLLHSASPQAARTVLPNSCKTEVIVYANLAEWRHILMLRTSPAAEPSMREVMIPLQEELRLLFPIIFN